MDFEKIKNIFSKKNRLFTFLSFFVIILLILYFKTFFTKGVYFYDKFLKKEVRNSEIHYYNKKIDIIVDRIDYNNTTVTYNLPEGLKKEFYIDYSTVNNLDFKINSIKNEYGNTLFEGNYQIGTIWLKDKNGEPIFDAPSLRIGGHSYVTFEATPLNTLNFAFSANDRFRGDAGPLMMAILIFILTFIDIKYPLFFFTLNHFLDVKDPEPTDFYLSMQKASWVVMPLIGILLMIAAIQT